MTDKDLLEIERLDTNLSTDVGENRLLDLYRALLIKKNHYDINKLSDEKLALELKVFNPKKFREIYSIHKLFIDKIISLNDEELLEFTSYTLYGDLMSFGVISKPLSEYMLSIPANAKKVLIADTYKFTYNLINLIKDDNSRYFYFYIKSELIRNIYKLIFSNLNVTFIDQDYCDKNFCDENFDYIVSCPLSRDNKKSHIKGDFISPFPEYAILENLYNHLNIGGQLKIISLNNFTFGSYDVFDLRKKICDEKHLREISYLPVDTLRGITMAKTVLLTIEKNEYEKTTFKQLEINSDTLTSKSTKEISPLEVNYNLSETSIFPVEVVNKNNYKQYKLKDIADIFRGKAITQKSETGKINILNISNIKEFSIDYSECEKLDATSREVSKYLLKKDDILITTRGTIKKVAIVDQIDKPYIPCVNLAAIRIKDTDIVNSLYLKLFFESNNGSKLLSSIQRSGSTILNINTLDLENLVISLPDIETQNIIAKKYQQGLNEYLKARTFIDDKWNKVKEEVEKTF